ncbi:MAG: DUF5320 domain-containing protein [Deltaproteobacteria bacterium]|nr:DUF5320 domain-containing protein [Deltaproteobacteria bacterium]
MPGLNGRGPQNQGPLTGRGLGNCRPAKNAENLNDQLRKVDPENLESSAVQADAAVVYGRGRGGQPRGGGQGLGRGCGGGRGRGRV